MAEVTDNRLRNHIEALERLDDEIAGIREDKKDRFLAAKSEGYDPKIIKIVMKIRKMKPADRQEMEELTGVYLAALGVE